MRRDFYEDANIASYNGGQKCWDLSSDITKTSDPLPSHPKQSWIWSKMGETEYFFGHNIARGGGGGGRGRWDEPKAEQKIEKLSLGTESYGTIAWKGFYTQSQVLLSSIVGLEPGLQLGFFYFFLQA